MNKLVFLFVTLLALPLQARELKVATITSNIDRDVSEFFLELHEDGPIEGLRIVRKNARGEVVQERRASYNEVSDAGMVLIHEANRDAVILRIENFTPEEGGKVIVDYLFSGISNTRKKLELGLKKTDADFFLHTPTGGSASQLKVFGNWSPLFGLIGIATIRVMDRWWGHLPL